MAFQKIFFVNAGVPATGLTLTWESLKDTDGVDYGSPPAITEIGGGWYKFTHPTLTADLVGVVDGGAALTSATDRYVPVNITPDDFGMTDLLDAITKGSQVLDPTANTLTIKRRDGSTLVVFDLTKATVSIGAYQGRAPQ